MPEIDQLSLTTVPIELFYKNLKAGAETSLGTVTSFVWKHRDDSHFLITNWHVVSARDAQTRKSLRSHGGRPNMLRAYFNFPGQQFGKIQADVCTRDQDDAPLWFIHPVEGAAKPRRHGASLDADTCIRTRMLPQRTFRRLEHPGFSISRPVRKRLSPRDSCQ